MVTALEAAQTQNMGAGVTDVNVVISFNYYAKVAMTHTLVIYSFYIPIRSI